LRLLTASLRYANFFNGRWVFSAQWWQHGTMLKTRSRLPGPVREHEELIAEFGFVVHASSV
jgi:hypothetical protein